jgi:hypothetical protein
MTDINKNHGKEPERLPNEYVTLDWIGRRWKTSRATPYRLVLNGKLKARNFGIGRKRSCWRVHIDDLIEYERSLSTPDRGSSARDPKYSY